MALCVELQNITNHGHRMPRFGRRGQLISNREASQVVSKRKPLGENSRTRRSCMRVATWNVKSLFAAGKLDNAIKEMKRMKIDLLGMSEVRWPESGTCKKDNTVLYYSGNGLEDTHHRNGVGILVTAELNKYVTNFVPISDRALLVQINTQPFKTNVLQIYAPTADRKYDDEIEVFYDQVLDILRKFKKHEITYIIGDFNAKVGEGPRGDAVGPYGLGSSNERGQRLFEFCEDNEMIITNTWYKLPKRRLYTWKAPFDDGNNPGASRNQIDYIIVNKRFRNAVKGVTTYPGADIGSDHQPLVADIKLRLKKCQQSKIKTNTVDFEDTDMKDRIKQEFNNKINLIESQLEDPEDLWNELKTKAKEILTNNVCKKDPIKNSKWMTDDILKLMEQRRLAKTNVEEYRHLQKEIKKEIKQAKEKWMSEKCAEMEDIMAKHDLFNMHKKVKEISGIFKKRVPPVLVNNDKKIIIDEEDIKTEWQTYISELFNDDRDDDMVLYQQCIEGPEIMRSEVEHAIKNAKTRKALGPDEIPTELLKLIDEENMKIIVKLFNAIYNTGVIPSDWLKSTFIAIPKKHRARKCSEYRLISLMSHTLKIFLRIIHSRIRLKCEENLEETQFGFRNALGTREALFALNVLLQKCRDQRKDIFVCFVDFEKAFDRVQHDKLIQILKNTGIDDKDVRIIKNLYWKQTANVKIGNSLTNEVSIQRGVRQGCILSPTLFNLYSDQLFKIALEGQPHGIKINGELLNVIRYADDTVILTDNIDGLQVLLNRIHEVGKEMGIKINESKTKFLVCSRNPYPDTKLELNGVEVERVHKFTYLGTIITDQLDPDVEIKRRIAMAKTNFLRMKSFLCNHHLNLEVRQKMVKCYIWSVLLYGMEAWTLKISTTNRIEALEMWIHRRMLKIPWTAHITNEVVLRKANKERELFRTIKRGKISYLGHILRGDRYCILQLILKGKIEGRRGVGRKQMSWLRNIRDWTEIRSAGQLFHMAKDREAFAMMIANVG